MSVSPPTSAPANRSGAVAPGGSRASLHDWLEGARPRTLPVAVVPVLVGTAVAAAAGHGVVWRTICALIVSLGIQIGTNYANDYSDGVRGTDSDRVGPVRLVASGLASPATVKRAAIASFAVAAVAGLLLALATSLLLLVVGAACIVAGWLYTGGPRPYGYAGFGEVFVFFFFGIVAVAGTAYVNLGHIDGLAFLAAVPVGLVAVALLVVNNLRDIPTDARAGKKTLAVRIGDGPTRRLFVACVLVPFLAIIALAAFRPGALIALPVLVFAAGPARKVRGGAHGPELIQVLGMVGRLQVVLGVLLAIGIVL